MWNQAKRFLFACLFLYAGTSVCHGCLPPDSRLNVYCREESTLSQLFRVVFGSQAKPRTIAVVAGVSEYAGLPILNASANDINELVEVLQERKYDEIIQIKNADFTRDNLEFIFLKYLPPVLRQHRNAQLLITFSGHGNEFDGEGYLLLPTGKKLEISDYDDTTEGWLSMGMLKEIIGRSVQYAHQTLILINSCKSGHFITRQEFGDDALAGPSVQVITAGGPRDSVAADESVGSFGGSIFFEAVVASLRGEPLRTATGPIPTPDLSNGVLTTDKMLTIIQDASNKAYGGSVLPIPGTFTRTPKDTVTSGSYFFILDEVRAKVFFSERYPDNFRTLFGDAALELNKTALSEAPDIADLLAMSKTLPYELEDVVKVAESGDWVGYKVDGRPGFCLMETTSVDSINKYMASPERTFNREIARYRAGEGSKLRLIYEKVSRTYLPVYVSRIDLSEGHEKLLMLPHINQAVASTIGSLVLYEPGSVYLFSQENHIEEQFKRGDFVVVEGYVSVTNGSETAAPLQLSSSARRYLLETVLVASRTSNFIGMNVEENPQILADFLKSQLRNFGIPFAQEDDDEVRKKAIEEGLSMDDVFALQRVTDDQIRSLVALYSSRETVFKDYLSLWGFGRVLRDTLAAC
ncbi:peptidase C14 caspase domain-containing protein (plasmid) [Rhizobium gallicum]|uniref:Peptidase C14 caspase domain-containing protein n=1 Tax=Rhizobium gallicum TaxID=56730 RepID=A0A1L5NWB4_9HYPH|nr:caspase family protein [Rhizobium gallicum]APO72203.1 peptidase C14 caspase domain-containing protein [Rhizobium gallicum]